MRHSIHALDGRAIQRSYTGMGNSDTVLKACAGRRWKRYLEDMAEHNHLSRQINYRRETMRSNPFAKSSASSVSITSRLSSRQELRHKQTDTHKEEPGHVSRGSDVCYLRLQDSSWTRNGWDSHRGSRSFASYRVSPYALIKPRKLESNFLHHPAERSFK